jgi:RNA polymerase sigma-70 factor (ECF subfamily)
MPSGEESRAWLFGVGYRVVRNKYRSRWRQKMLAIRLEALKTGERSEAIFGPAPSREVQLLHRALDGLSSTDRELLRLTSWDGLTRGEIAHVLGIKENAVDQRLYRARSRLKARFDRLNGVPRQKEQEEASA